MSVGTVTTCPVVVASMSISFVVVSWPVEWRPTS